MHHCHRNDIIEESCACRFSELEKSTDLDTPLCAASRLFTGFIIITDSSYISHIVQLMNEPMVSNKDIFIYREEFLMLLIVLISPIRMTVSPVVRIVSGAGLNS